MKSVSVMVAFSLLTAGCAVAPPESAATAVPDRIVYETGPCFGACPVYRVVVNSEGAASFEGLRFTAAQGLRSFQVTPEQYRRFVAALAPLRPKSGSVRYSGPPLCRNMATDLPSVSVTWSGAGEERSLYYYFGCDMEKTREMADRLRAAPQELPIAQFIKTAQS